MHIIKPLPGTLPMPGHPLADAVGLWSMNSLGNQVFDLSGNNHKGILVGATSWSEGKFGFALLGDSVNTCVTLSSPVIAATSDFVFVFWVNPSDSSGGNLATQYGVGQDGRLAFQHGANTVNKFKYFIAHAAGVNVDFESNNTFLADNWYQVIYRRDGNYFSLYVDGVLEGSQIENGVSVYQGANTKMGIRDGLTDHAILYNRALSATKRSLLYREPFCMFPEPIMREFGIAA